MATPDVTLTANSGLNTCPGNHASFTCEVRGHHPIVAWTANDPYIASEQPLEFSSSSTEGVQKQDRKRPDTVATLTNKTSDGSIMILRSVLNLTVSSNSRSFNVTCTGTDRTSQTLTIDVPRKPIYSFSTTMIYLFSYYTCIAIPEMPQSIVLEHFSDNGTCALISTAWKYPKPGDYIYKYAIYMDGENVLNKIHQAGNDVSIAKLPVCDCNAHNISVAAISRCGAEGPSSPPKLLEPPSQLCDSSQGTGPTGIGTTTTDDNDGESSDSTHNCSSKN